MNTKKSLLNGKELLDCAKLYNDELARTNHSQADFHLDPFLWESITFALEHGEELESFKQKLQELREE